MSSPSNSETVIYRGHEAILRCDLSFIHPSLGNLVQLFVRDDDAYGHLDDRQYWESTFRLFLHDGQATLNAQHLGRAEKDLIWQEVFRLKNKFLQERRPDVVVHRIKYPFPFERRLALYRERLDFTDYDLWASGDLIWLERKLTPAEKAT